MNEAKVMGLEVQAREDKESRERQIAHIQRILGISGYLDRPVSRLWLKFCPHCKKRIRPAVFHNALFEVYIYYYSCPCGYEYAYQELEDW